MIRPRVRVALRALGRAALDGLATENGWCRVWGFGVWGFGPAPGYLYTQHRHGAFRDASAAPAAASAARSSGRPPWPRGDAAS